MDDFKILKKVKDYDLYFRKQFLNKIPAVCRELRIRISDTNYNLLHNTFLLYFSDDYKKKKDYCNEILTNLSELDYYLNYLVEGKKFDKSAEKILVILSQITPMVYGYRKTLKNV